MGTYDFKKELPKIKKQFSRLSQEALVLAKKGEKELVKLSRQGKLQVDAAALALKRERLYLAIGKAYAQQPCDCPKSDKMQKVLAEVGAIDKQVGTIQKKIKIVARGKK